MTDGRCRPMDCAAVTCGAGQYCQGGRCLDACQGAVCPRGGRCVAGACVEPVTLADAGADSGSDAGRDAAADGLPPVDAPFFQDVSVAMDDGPREPTPIAGSESGCGCRTTTGDARGVGLALLAAAAALSGRRRRR
jgi:MYXO-CTERM domain-containing protein